MLFHTWPFLVFLLADTGTNRGYQRADFVVVEHFVEPRFFYIKNFPFKRQNRLKLPVAPLFCRAAC